MRWFEIFRCKGNNYYYKCIFVTLHGICFTFPFPKCYKIDSECYI